MYTVHFPTIQKFKVTLVTLFLLTLLLFMGTFHHLFEKDFYNDFHYPYDGDLEHLVLKLRRNQTPEVPIINSYNFYYYKNCDSKCNKDITDLRIVYIVKSAPPNFHRRLAIRSSWGFQRRFSDVEIRTVFLVGLQNHSNLQVMINEEYQRFNDIVQANYTDHYYNNTYKAMSGFEWAVKYCPNAKFYMFIDDDYYISTKNVLRFLRFPTNYPQYLKEPLGRNFLKQKRKPLGDVEFELDNNVRLYTGYTFRTSPHRHFISKWYVSLEEYPYHLWPAYVSGGAYILSNAALKDMYYASFYTKHFRFDDIYVGILAYKMKIEPFHSEDFCFYKKPYNKYGYEYVVASHGYGDPKELISVWNEQKSLGHA